MADLIERASVRAGEISTGTTSVARDNQGIDLELLVELLNEVRVISGRKPRPVDEPRGWLKLLLRFRHWMKYK